MSSVSAGVFSQSMICRLSSSPKPLSATLRARKASIAVEMAAFILPYSLAPKYCPTTTEAPTPPPMAMQMNTSVSAWEAPTAAKACSPTYRPTMAESAIV